jgi:hypothetical protein
MNELQHTLQRSLGVFKTLDKHAALFQNINFLKDILKKKTFNNLNRCMYSMK